MGQALESLQRLQTVEKQLAQLRRERDSRAQRVEFQKRKVRNVDEKIQKAELTLRQRQVRLDALQLDIAGREEAVNRHRQALNRAKTNKEYAAILTTMNTEKADNAKLETEMLQLMEEIQSLAEEVKNLKAERSKLAENVTGAEEALFNYEEESKAKFRDLTANRQSCAAHVDANTLATFERIAEHNEGEALAPIVKLHRRRDEYICSGCNLKITLEIVNALQTRDDLQVCKVCGRILYLESAPSTQKSRV